MLHIRQILLLAVAGIALSACDMFKIDNYAGPNATISGGILDEVTGELVETDVQNGSRLQLQELGYAPGLLTRIVNYTGEYQDKLFFAGAYSINFNACNFYPFKVDTIVFHKGDNVQDFKVKPYIRVKNVNITHEGNEIIATFSLQAGNPEVRLSNVRLYASTDVHVGDQYTSHNPDGDNFQLSFSPAAVINDATTYKLHFDLTTTRNNAYFKVKRDYFFRVGAMASVPNPSSVTGGSVGTVRRNYAHYTMINFNAP